MSEDFSQAFLAKRRRNTGISSKRGRLPIVTTPKEKVVLRYAPVPGYWVKNIDQLREIIENGVAYFDLITRIDFWSICISDIPYKEQKSDDDRLILFNIAEEINDDLPVTRRVQVGDFWETSVIAMTLSLMGIEVMYGSNNSDNPYLSFTESLSTKVFDHEQDEEINQVIGTAEPMEKPPIKTRPTNRTSIHNLLTQEELEATPNKTEPPD